MKQIVASIIVVLCIVSVALARYTTVTTTVVTSDNAVTYNYRLTNTTSSDIWQFAVFMPMGAADTINSYSTSQDGWSTIIRKAGFDMIGWDWNGTGVIGIGQSADFSFTTADGIPTTYTFTTPGSNSNWGWAYGIPGGGTVGDGNIILPVPAPVPEPSSILALVGGIAGLGGFALRRRRS
jgi:hypothetical protein